MKINKNNIKIMVGILSLMSMNAPNAAVYSNGSKTATFDVTMKVVHDCIISANNMSFGNNQGIIVSEVSATGNLSITCTNSTPYNIGLNEGNVAGSTIAKRYMAGATDPESKVEFNLYQDAGTTIWGNTQGVDTKNGVGNGVAQTMTISGKVPVQTSPKADTYKTSITATVYF